MLLHAQGLLALERGIQSYLHVLGGGVPDLSLPGEQIARDHSAIHTRTQRDMRLVLAKIASADQCASTGNLNRRTIFLPLHESAVAETNRAPGDLRDLVARSPERAVAESDHAFVTGKHLHHGGVFTMERSEFAVRDQQSIRCALFHQDRAIAVIRTDAEKIAVTFSRFRVHELVAYVVSEAERVQHVFPICAAEEKRFAVLGLPLVHPATPVPPRIEVDILNPPGKG